jgi:hypothetical protein
MKSRLMITVGAATYGATLSVALAQSATSGAPGNWTIHTASKTGCPGLVLHLMRDRDALKGIAATGDMAGMSRLAGTINANDQFSITMTPVDGKGPVGTITGSRNVEDGWLLAEVKGSGCTDGRLKIKTEIPDEAGVNG